MDSPFSVIQTDWKCPLRAYKSQISSCNPGKFLSVISSFDDTIMLNPGERRAVTQTKRLFHRKTSAGNICNTFVYNKLRGWVKRIIIHIKQTFTSKLIKITLAGLHFWKICAAHKFSTAGNVQRVRAHGPQWCNSCSRSTDGTAAVKYRPQENIDWHRALHATRRSSSQQATNEEKVFDESKFGGKQEAYVWICRWCNSLLKHRKTVCGCGGRVCAACRVFARFVFCFFVGGFCLFFVCCDLWFSAPDRPETTPAVWLTDLGLIDFGFLTFWKGRKFLYEAGFDIYRHVPNSETSDLFWDYTFTNERTRSLVDTL